MKPNTSLVFACLLISAMAEFQEENSVIILTADTFQDAISQYKFILVEFYAPWSDHSNWHLIILLPLLNQRKLVVIITFALPRSMLQLSQNLLSIIRSKDIPPSLMANLLIIQEVDKPETSLNGFRIREDHPPFDQDLASYIEKSTAVPIVVFFKPLKMTMILSHLRGLPKPTIKLRSCTSSPNKSVKNTQSLEKLLSSNRLVRGEMISTAPSLEAFIKPMQIQQFSLSMTKLRM